MMKIMRAIILFIIFLLGYSDSFADISEIKIDKNESSDNVNFSITIWDSAKTKPLNSLHINLKNTDFSIDNALSLATYSIKSKTTVVGRKKVVAYFHTYNISLDKKSVGKINGSYEWLITANESISKSGGFSSFTYVDLISPSLAILDHNKMAISNLGTLNYPDTPENLVLISAADNDTAIPKITAVIRGSDGSVYDLIASYLGSNTYKLSGFSYLKDNVVYTVAVTATDDAQNQVSQNFTFTCARDDEAPIIRFYNNKNEIISTLGTVSYPIKPHNNFYFVVSDNKDQNPQIQLFFSKSGDKKISINADCSNHQEGKVCIANLSEEQIENLTNNISYRFDVLASDGFKNKSSNSLSFTYRDDADPPEINYLSSSNNILSQGINLVWPQSIENEIKINAYDKLDGNPKVNIYFDNQEIGFDLGSDHLYFLKKITEPANGIHKVKTTVCDKRKNCSVKELTINYSRDNSPPIIKIFNTFDETINNQHLILKYPNNFYSAYYFEVVDNRDADLITSAFLDGDAIAIDCNGKKCNFAAVDKKLLHNTDHVLMITSRDNNGNIASENFSFHYTDDIKAPEISFINKQTGDDFGNSRLPLKYPNVLTDVVLLKITDDFDLDLASLKVNLILDSSLSNNEKNSNNSNYDADNFITSNIAVKETGNNRKNNGDIERWFELAIDKSLYEKLVHNCNYLLEVKVADKRGNLAAETLAIHYVYDDIAPSIAIFRNDNLISDSEQSGMLNTFAETEENTINLGKISWPNKFEEQIFFSVSDNRDPNPVIQVFLNNEKLSYSCRDLRCFIISDQELKNNQSYEITIIAQDHYHNQTAKKIFFSYDCDENPPVLDFVDQNLKAINSPLTVHWPLKLSDQIKIAVSDDRSKDPKVTINLISNATDQPLNISLQLENNNNSDTNNADNCIFFDAENRSYHEHYGSDNCEALDQKNMVGEVKKINFANVPLVHKGSYTIYAKASDEKGNTTVKELTFIYIEDDEKPKFNFYYDSTNPSDTLKKIYGLGPLNFTVADNRAAIVKIKALLKDPTNNNTESLGIISADEKFFHLEQPLSISLIAGKTYELVISGEDDYGNISQHQIELYYQNKIEAKDDIKLPMIGSEVLDPKLHHTYDLGVLYTFAGNELGKNTYVYFSLAPTVEGAIKVNGKLLDSGKTIRFLLSDLFLNRNISDVSSQERSLNSNYNEASTDNNNYVTYSNHSYLDIASTDQSLEDQDYEITLRTSEDTPDFTFKVSFYKPQIVLSGPNEAQRIQDTITISPSVNNNLCDLTLDRSKALSASPNNPICLLRYTFIPSDLKLANMDLKGRLSEAGENSIEASLLWLQGSAEYLLSSDQKIIETSDIEAVASNLVVNKDEIFAQITEVNMSVHTDETFCSATFNDEIAKLNNFSTSEHKCLIKWISYPQEFDWNDNDDGLSGVFLKEGSYRFAWEIYVYTSEESKTLVSKNYEDIKVINVPNPVLSFSSNYDLVKIADTNNSKKNTDENNGKNENESEIAISTNKEASYEVYIPTREYDDTIFLGTLKIIAPVNQVIVAYDGKEELIKLKNGIGELKIYQNVLSLYQEDLRTFKVYYPQITDDQFSSALNLAVFAVPDLNLKVYVDTLKEIADVKNIKVITSIDKAARGGFDKNKYGDWEISLFVKQKQEKSADSSTNNNLVFNKEITIGQYQTIKAQGNAEFVIDLSQLNFSQDQIKIYARARLKSPYLNYHKEIISDGAVVKLLHLEGIDGDIKSNRLAGFAPLTVLFAFSFADEKLKKSTASIEWQYRKCDLADSACTQIAETDVTSSSNDKISDQINIMSSSDEDNGWSNLANETKKFSLSRKFNAGIYQIRVKTVNQYSNKIAYSKPISITVYRKTVLDVSSPKNAYVGESIAIAADTYFKNVNANLNKQSGAETKNITSYIYNSENINVYKGISNNVSTEPNLSSDIVLEASLDYGKTWQQTDDHKINFFAREKGIKTVYLRAYDTYAKNNIAEAAAIKKIAINIVEHKAPNITLTGPSYLEPNKESQIYSKLTSYYEAIEREKCIEKLGTYGDDSYADALSSKDNASSQQINECLDQSIAAQYQGYFAINEEKIYGNVLRFKPTAADIAKGMTNICYVSYLATNSAISRKFCKRFKVHDYVFPNFKLTSSRYVSYAPSKITVTVKPELYSLEELKTKTNLNFSWNIEGKGIVYSCSEDSSTCIIKSDQAGDIIVNVFITDEFNHSSLVSQKYVLAESPKLLSSIILKTDNPYYRAPLGVVLSYSREGGHPNDQIKNIEFLVDGEIVAANENNCKLILSEGIHLIKVHIKTEYGYESYAQKIIEVFKNQLPLCKIKFEEDDINYRFKAKCEDHDGRVKLYRWYIDDKLSKVTAWQIAVAKSNYQNGYIPKVSLEAIDDAEGVSLKISND